MNNNRSSQKASVKVPVLLLVLTIVIAIAWGLPNEQNDLAEKSLQFLSKDGLDTDNYTVKFSGRDAYLEGTNVPVEEVERAASRMETINGVRKVTFKAINYTVGIEADTQPGPDVAVNHQNQVTAAIENTVVDSTPVIPVPEPEVPEVQQPDPIVQKVIVETEQLVKSTTEAVDSVEQDDASFVGKAVGMLAKVGELVTGSSNSNDADQSEVATQSQGDESENGDSVSISSDPKIVNNDIVGSANTVSPLQQELDELMKSGRFLFQPGRIEWPPFMHQALVRVANILKENPDSHVKIEAFSVPVRNAEFSKTLSQSRAQQVKTYLVYQGVQESQLSMQGYGFDPEKMKALPVPSSIRFLVKGDSE